MSFIGKTNEGTTYAPGYFIAAGDEAIQRETKEISASSALVVTTDEGGKYVPMGTAYPTNDGNAVGILYEDVDVTTGNMPGSVITGGATVYEDRLAITDITVSYDAVTPAGTENPSTEGWYEKVNDEYVLTTDTEVDSEKAYYEKTETVTRISAAAKSALEALGFKFITAAPAVTRPY